MYNGDISFERLSSKGYEKDPTAYSYTQACAPLILMTLTRLRIPASTSLLLLALFSSKTSAFLSVVQKSMTGYVVSFACTIVGYAVLYRGPIKRLIQSEDKGVVVFIIETIASCYLWINWLMQDVSSFSVYLKRQLSVFDLILTLVWLFLLLGIVSYTRGERVQSVVESKFNTNNLKECALMDFTYGTILLIFKERNKLPMSTTWTFLGLLSGREIGIVLTDFTCDRLIRALKMMAIELG